MSADFAPFDSRGPLEIRRRHLPHWEQPGATYFVTFRLADSLPREVLERLAELHRLRRARVPARPSDAPSPQADDDTIFTHLDEHLDAGVGTCLLAEPDNARIVAASLQHFDSQRYHLGAFVVMPNHVHALVQPRTPFDLTQIVHGWKSFTAHRLQQLGRASAKVWQDERFDRLVREEGELRRFHDYILANPAKARLAQGRFVAGQGEARWW